MNGREKWGNKMKFHVVMLLVILAVIVIACAQQEVVQEADVAERAPAIVLSLDVSGKLLEYEVTGVISKLKIEAETIDYEVNNKIIDVTANYTENITVGDYYSFNFTRRDKVGTWWGVIITRE